MSRDPSIFDRRNPSGWLPGYRAVVFNHEGRGAYVVEIDADHDSEALKQAREKAGKQAFELWDARCMIGRYAPNDGVINC